MSSTKNRSALNSLLKPEGGPQLCATCSKAVRVVGLILLFVALGVIFTVLSFIRGTGDAATVAGTALLTLGCAALLAVILGRTLGLSFLKRRKAENSGTPASSHAGRKPVKAVVCDGCTNTFQPKD